MSNISFAIWWRERTPVLTVRGRVDESTADLFCDTARCLLECEPRVVIDLTRVTVIDAKGDRAVRGLERTGRVEITAAEVRSVVPG